MHGLIAASPSPKRTADRHNIGKPVTTGNNTNEETCKPIPRIIIFLAPFLLASSLYAKGAKNPTTEGLYAIEFEFFSGCFEVFRSWKACALYYSVIAKVVEVEIQVAERHFAQNQSVSHELRKLFGLFHLGFPSIDDSIELLGNVGYFMV
jgi:hypothetical protein